MKATKYQISILLCFILYCNGRAQGFVNLDFEAANLSGYGTGSVPASDAIPGWTAYIGTTTQTDIVYNELSLGAPSIAIMGTNGGPAALDGAYSIDLYGGAGPSTSVSISQTALVPASTASILFIAQGVNPPSGGGPLQVSLGGQSISFSAISIEPNYTLYGGNVPSPLAGQIEQLTFSAPTDGGNNYWEIDDIQFSPSAVPEPSVLGLSALGGLFFAWRRWRKSS